VPRVAQKHLQERKEKKSKNHKKNNSGSILGLELELGLVTCHQVTFNANNSSNWTQLELEFFMGC
jgi:hypothetical protein